MGKVFINEETLIGIGNAIREKNGTTDLVNTTDMANAILNLPSGGGTLKYAVVQKDTGTSTNSIYKYNLTPYVKEDNTVFIYMSYYDYHFSTIIENGVMGNMYSVEDGEFFYHKSTDSRNRLTYADGILSQTHGGSTSYAPGCITIFYVE